MDQSVIESDQAVHQYYNPDEHFPFGRHALIEQIKTDFYGLIKILRGYTSSNPFFFLFLLLMLPVTLFAVQRASDLFSHAQTNGNTGLSFSPSTVNLPPSAPVKIMLNSGSAQIAFARVVFTFDKNKVNLGNEITTNPNLSTAVQKSSKQEANSSGKAIIVIAASPTDIKPSGNIELASFSLTNVTSSAGGSTSLVFDTNDMQIVDSAGSVVTSNTSSLTVTLNGSLQPTAPVPTVNQNACLGGNISSQNCYNLWKNEYTKAQTTRNADLNNDGNIDLKDFEIWRRAAYP